MKKILYSIMAVALCACSQSDVDENLVTPPQPENKGVTFTVVDNGFVGEDGTRVTYGNYGSADNGAYKATFVEGDQIGVYAITAMGTDNTPAAYKFENKPLTLKNGVWKSAEILDLTDVKVLFAYSPYREDIAQKSGKPLFTGADGSWAVDTGNNRFFVEDYTNTNNSTEKDFKAADWMGAATNITSGQTDITFNMIHMREMIELTTDPNVELIDLTLDVGNGKWSFDPFLFATTKTKKVYRILTTEYRSTNTVYATIQDDYIVKKYKKTLSGNGAGKCFCVNINYTPEETITVNDPTDPKLLADILKTMGTAPTTLRLAGTLTDADWTYLQSLSLTSLDMYNLKNTEIPANWMKNATTLKESLTSLVLPNGLTTIGGDALQFGSKQISIELPTSVTTLGNGAFYGSSNLSVRIPEGSNLQTIGQGAFKAVKAVYTNVGNVNVLKIPASVTNIDIAAFGETQQLKMVIFQPSDSTPTIGDDNGYARTFENNVVIYVPNANYKGKFPGNTVVTGQIALTDKDYVSEYTTGDGAGLPGLCDNNFTTHWHSTWSNEVSGDDTYGHFIDITVPAMTKLAVMYVTRSSNNNATPTKIDIYTSSDGTNWGTALFALTNNDNLPQGSGEAFVTTAKEASSFTKIRFAVTESKFGTLCGSGSAGHCTALGELSIFSDMWTEAAQK